MVREFEIEGICLFNQRIPTTQSEREQGACSTKYSSCNCGIWLSTLCKDLASVSGVGPEPSRAVTDKAEERDRLGLMETIWTWKEQTGICPCLPPSSTPGVQVTHKGTSALHHGVAHVAHVLGAAKGGDVVELWVCEEGCYPWPQVQTADEWQWVGTAVASGLQSTQMLLLHFHGQISHKLLLGWLYHHIEPCEEGN